MCFYAQRQQCLDLLILTAILLGVSGTVRLLRAEILTRDEAVSLVLEQNPEVQAAKQEWEIYNSLRTQAWAPPEPEFGLEYEELPKVTSPGSFGNRFAGFSQTVEFPLEWWYRGRAFGKQAESVKYAVYEMTRLDLAARAKIAFDRVLYREQVLTYAERNLELARDFYEKTQIRFDAGEIAQLEVLRASVEEGRAENEVTVARNELSVARAGLNTLLARNAESPIQMEGEFVYRPLELKLDALRDLATDHRPDLHGARLSVSSTRLNRSRAISSLVPSLNIGISRQTINGLSARENFSRLTLALEVPAWAFWRQRGEINQANAELDRSIAIEKSVQYSVRLEVERACLDLKAAEEQVRLFQDRVLPQAEKAYEVATSSYDQGKSTYLEVLEAQRVLNSTRFDYAESIFNYRSALSNLERAVGKDINQ